jgi:hypothetical protein
LTGAAALGTASVLPGFSFAAESHPLLDTAITVDTHSHLGAYWRSDPFGAALRGNFKALEGAPITAFTYPIPADVKNSRITGGPQHFVKEAMRVGVSELDKTGISVARSAGDIVSAKTQRKKACLLAIEGVGFAEDKFEAVAEA